MEFDSTHGCSLPRETRRTRFSTPGRGWGWAWIRVHHRDGEGGALMPAAGKKCFPHRKGVVLVLEITVWDAGTPRGCC